MEHTCRLGSSFAEAASNAVDEPNRRKDRIGWENLAGASPKQRRIYIGTCELNGMCERGAGIAAGKGRGWGGLAHERSRGYKRAWANKRGQERKTKYLEGGVWVGMWKREDARGFNILGRQKGSSRNGGKHERELGREGECERTRRCDERTHEVLGKQAGAHLVGFIVRRRVPIIASTRVDSGV